MNKSGIDLFFRMLPSFLLSPVDDSLFVILDPDRGDIILYGDARFFVVIVGIFIERLKASLLFSAIGFSHVYFLSIDVVIT